MNTKSIKHNILNFPLTKILLGLLVCVGIVAIGQIAIRQVFDLTAVDRDLKRLIEGVLIAILAVSSYYFLFRFYEKRNISELSVNRIGRYLLFGILLGLVLQSLTILVIYINNGFIVVSVNNFLFLLPSLTMAFTAAIFEEVLFRGILFRIIEEKLGSYLALGISAVIFGAMHLANPNSSLLAATGLAIQAGLLLGVAYMYSRNLWFPIAIHFAWNFSQSGIFGAATSGNAVSKSLLTTRIEGMELVTGGQFGPEGSIQATLFCLAATVVLLILCNKQNRILKPYWKK